MLRLLSKILSKNVLVISGRLKCFQEEQKGKDQWLDVKFNPFGVRKKLLSLQTTVNIKAFKTGYQNYYFKNLKMFTYKMKDLGDVKVK